MDRKFTFVAVLTLLGLALGACSEDKTPDSNVKENYIVVLAKQSRGGLATKAMVTNMMNKTSSQYKLEKAKRVFTKAIQGGVVEMTAAQAAELSRDVNIAYVEKDQVITIGAVQNNPTWGLDRIDQDDLPLSDSYAYPDTGASNVNAYVIDTGVRNSHDEFGGRASDGADFVDDDGTSNDCNGHGTHVAGTIGSEKYGVAKDVKLHGVRVLNCRGSGSISDVIAGVDWVTENHVKPAVANMSLGGGNSQALDDAVVALVQSGVTVVVAAGNSNRSACSGSPNRVAQAISVGATTESDKRSSFSNYGECVDIFAPGSDIESAYYTSDSATDTLSGTSMAAPHVAGVVALYLGQNPDATPDEVEAALLAGAVSGKLSDLRTGSPNLLLSNLYLEDGSDDDIEPNPEDDVVELGEVVSELSGASQSEVSYRVVLSENVKKLTIEIFGGSGDADLYVKKGSEATRTQYDCRPYRNGNVEKCEVGSAGAGTYYIMLRGYRSYSGVSLKASAETEVIDSLPCSDCSVVSDTLTGSADINYHPEGSYYQRTSSSNHQIWLEGPSDADFDIYLMKWDGSAWKSVARSTKNGSDEQINYFGEAGLYTIKVDSFTGVGSYKLYYK